MTETLDQDDFPWLAVLAGVSLIGLLSTLSAVSIQRMEGEPGPIWPAFWSSIAPWLVWGVAAKPVSILSRRYPLSLPPAGRALAVHLGAAMALVLIQTAVTVGVSRLVYSATGPWATWFLGYLASRGVLNLVLYAGLAGLFHAVDARSRLRRQQLQSAELATDLARAELHALQLQLQPHFLFNTLHAIGVLNQEDPARATRMLAALGDLLRGSLHHRATQEIPLEEEFGLLERYLEIEAIRFSDRLTVEIEVPPELGGHLVPTFLLQPLVENAIRYGVARRAAPSRIRIEGTAGGGNLTLTVWNDGSVGDLGHVVDGVGLATTRDRLRRLYGDRARLELENRDGGVLATVVLPIHDEPVL